MNRRLPLLIAALAILLPLLVTLVAPGLVFPSWDRSRDALAQALRARPSVDWRDDPELQMAALALMAQEDRRLPSRWGPMDLRSCGRALLSNLVAGEVREGCSTLQMQLARLAMPAELFAQRTWTRKLMQVRLSVGLIGTAPERVLDAYLAALPCGSDLAVGLDRCALLHFGRTAEQLSAAEAVALLTSVPAPSRELRDIEAARARVRRSLSAALGLGWLSADQVASILESPLQIERLHPDLVRAAAAGRDVALTTQLQQAIAAARAAAVDKQDSPDDLLILGAVYDADGALLASGGGPASWFSRPFEAGSWVKPFCAAALLDAPGLGERYLERDPIPLRLPLYDRNLKRYRPDNAAHNLPERAPPAEWVLRSVNTATLAAMIFAPVTLSGAQRADWLNHHLTAAERAKYSTATDLRLTRELVSAYVGFPVTTDEIADLPGYRALTLAATRACIGRMRQHVPNLEVPREDLSALLGTVRAPLSELATGLAQLWLKDGQPTPLATLMARHAAEGTLARLTGALGQALPYKTATATRNAMLAIVLPSPDGPRVLVLAAVRPSGAPISPIQGGTLAPGVLTLPVFSPGGA